MSNFYPILYLVAQELKLGMKDSFLHKNYEQF
jgi:hypothetical protein